MSDVIAALSRLASTTPQRCAVTGSRGTLSWRQLASEVDRLARVLGGVPTLGTLLANSPAWIAIDLAAVQADVTHVPLPSFFSDTQLGHALRDARIDTVITDEPERIAALATVTARDTLWIDGYACTRLRLAAGAPRVGQAAIAKVSYTSGTTGTPRGVRLTRDAIETVAAALCRSAVAGSADRAMALLPLSILLENIGTVYAAILSGAQICVPDPVETGMGGSSRADAARLVAVLDRYRPTALIVPPALLKLLTVLARRQAVPDSLRFIAVGGAPVGSALLEAAAACDLPVYQGYGLSEAASVVAMNTPADNRPGSVGRPLAHMRVQISATGEILVQGKTFAGYLGEDARDPGALLATGDTGHFDADGFLYVTGRMHERIITPYGRNVSPEWVEAELQAHPAIAQAAVFGRDRPQLLAVLVPSGPDGRTALVAAVADINARLPDYARIGDWVGAAEPFSMASGELAPGGSPRRDVIERRYFQQPDDDRQQAHARFL